MRLTSYDDCFIHEVTVSRERKQLPPPGLVDAAGALFAVLSNPMRLQLLVALGRLGPMSAGELQEIVDGEQTAVSHHLAALRRSRLVAVEREGRRMIYSLLDDHVAHIVEDALRHVNE